MLANAFSLLFDSLHPSFHVSVHLLILLFPVITMIFYVFNQDNEKSYAPDVVVPIMVALERSAYEALGNDFLKYNQKLRQLVFNIKVCMFLSWDTITLDAYLLSYHQS